MSIGFERKQKKEIDKLFKRWNKKPDICPECSSKKYSKSEWRNKNIEQCPSCEFEPRVKYKLQRVYGEALYKRNKELEAKRFARLGVTSRAEYELKYLEKKYGKMWETKCQAKD